MGERESQIKGDVYVQQYSLFLRVLWFWSNKDYYVMEQQRTACLALLVFLERPKTATSGAFCTEYESKLCNKKTSVCARVCLHARVCVPVSV